MEAGTGAGAGVGFPNSEPPKIDGAPPDVLGNSSGISEGAPGVGVAGVAVTGATTGGKGAPGAIASGPREFCEFKKAGLNGVCPAWGSTTGTTGGPGVTDSKTNPGTAGTVPGKFSGIGWSVTGGIVGPAGEFRKFGANDSDGVG